MLVELTMHSAGLGPAPNSPIDGIRILALLPEEWRKDLRQANGEIVIRVETGDDITSTEISARVKEALTDPTVSHWRLYACDPVPGPAADAP
ncbi:hypothetical protein Ssi03_72130 [Sphaerisporangium siamense]|uniref:Uncharacterized protein n=1 Tax=Sphaerisporangium siamense TaxID=795645 RepID=A0A7W7DAD5_9ACTN|nr:hypothetical protein [Sphaerisporangium siamense]MBB4703202.1 hypothetical protein [Sphaerisporangium siamense]GII89223.1 hypothetical protein Ssi03_72130 [Sphaerisporangium siamense]